MTNPVLLWLVIGVLLCSLEMIFPTAFMAFILGIGAIAVGMITYLLPISPNVQIVLWLLLSTMAIICSRRFLTPKITKRILSDDTEAETLTAIAAGKAGRVLYEGNSWRAKCADDQTEIAANEVVYVVRQEGTTLIVMPPHLLKP